MPTDQACLPDRGIGCHRQLKRRNTHIHTQETTLRGQTSWISILIGNLPPGDEEKVTYPGRRT